MDEHSDATISHQSLSEYVEYAESVIDQYPQMNEENTKLKLINEFLSLLGWDIAFDAELEYSITMGNSSTYYVDYALLDTSSTPAFLVETKGYDTQLSDRDRGQLGSYLRQTDVTWGLLTNGQVYDIYRREIVDNSVEIQTVASLKLEELPQYIDHIRLLSKDVLESGHSRELIQQILDIQNARKTLRDKKEDIAEDLTRVLTDTVGDVVSQEAKTEAKVLVDRLIESLDEKTDSDEADSFWEKVESQTSIRKADESIELVENKTNSEDFINFVTFLFENEHLKRTDLPLESGNTRYLLNSEPTHIDGSEMREGKKIADGVYLETNNNTDFKKRWMLKLGEMVQR